MKSQQAHRPGAPPAHREAGRGSGRGYFVTGTDTGVGKTLFACALVHAFSAAGQRAAGMKPVAAGAERRAGVLENDDVRALKAAAGLDLPDALVNPYCFEPPIAPHIAAAEAATAIELERIHAAYRELAGRLDCVVVEGAGGFYVPLGAGIDTCDLARTLDLPVILVVGLRLGCLNHALLTAAAVRAAGLELAGWVANHLDPEMARVEENVSALKERLRAPLIARLPFRRDADPARVAPLIALDALDERYPR